MLPLPVHRFAAQLLRVVLERLMKSVLMFDSPVLSSKTLLHLGPSQDLPTLEPEETCQKLLPPYLVM